MLSTQPLPSPTWSIKFINVMVDGSVDPNDWGIAPYSMLLFDFSLFPIRTDCQILWKGKRLSPKGRVPNSPPPNARSPMPRGVLQGNDFWLSLVSPCINTWKATWLLYPNPELEPYLLATTGGAISAPPVLCHFVHVPTENAWNWLYPECFWWY